MRLEVPTPYVTCESCGQPAMPGQKFCRRCGARLPVIPGAAAPPPRPEYGDRHPAAPAAAVATRPHQPGAFKRMLKVIIPVAALIAAYYTNDFINKTFGAQLVDMFGDVSRQVVPVLVFMVIGGIAYKLTR
jgi:hypothetical protein